MATQRCTQAVEVAVRLINKNKPKNNAYVHEKFINVDIVQNWDDGTETGMQYKNWDVIQNWYAIQPSCNNNK